MGTGKGRRNRDSPRTMRILREYITKLSGLGYNVETTRKAQDRRQELTDGTSLHPGDTSMSQM